MALVVVATRASMKLECVNPLKRWGDASELSTGIRLGSVLILGLSGAGVYIWRRKWQARTAAKLAEPFNSVGPETRKPLSALADRGLGIQS